jgi:thiol-disulfide isomerase/thioredoxin
VKLIVACLCAQWCSSCREYRSTFERISTEFAEGIFLWIDVEDQSALVDPVEVENFPTLLIGAGDRPLFFGPVAPQEETLARMVRACLGQQATDARIDPEVRALMQRLYASSMDLPSRSAVSARD